MFGYGQMPQAHAGGYGLEGGSYTLQNAAGATVHKSLDIAHTNELKFYCGRFVGTSGYEHWCGGCDGNCGPRNGCQCRACAQLQRQTQQLSHQRVSLQQHQQSNQHHGHNHNAHPHVPARPQHHANHGGHSGQSPAPPNKPYNPPKAQEQHHFDHRPIANPSPPKHLPTMEIHNPTIAPPAPAQPVYVEQHNNYPEPDVTIPAKKKTPAPTPTPAPKPNIPPPIQHFLTPAAPSPASDNNANNNFTANTYESDVTCQECSRKAAMLVLTPCGHRFCDECGNNAQKCPNCRKDVTSSFPLY